jgi:hypothetical protein
MRKKIIVFAGFILMMAVFSIFRCSCKEKKYNLESLNIKLKRITGTKLSNNGSYELTMEDIADRRDDSYVSYRGNGTSVPYDCLAIEVSVKSVYLVANDFNRNIPGISLAYALTRPDTWYEKITDIIITSNKDYNFEYQAGTNLKNILSVRKNTHKKDATNSIGDVLQNLYARGGMYILFTFDIPPETEEVHEITIKYVTENGQIVSTVAKNVMILK